MSDTAKRVANAYGCRDSACMFGGGAAGISTNGGCSCLDGLDYLSARKVRLAVRALLRETERLEATAPRWIPVSERLPDEGIGVLIHGGEADALVGWFYGDQGWQDHAYDDIEGVTHWMPLPAPPTVEDKR